MRPTVTCVGELNVIAGDDHVVWSANMLLDLAN